MDHLGNKINKEARLLNDSHRKLESLTEMNEVIQDYIKLLEEV